MFRISNLPRVAAFASLLALATAFAVPAEARHRGWRGPTGDRGDRADRNIVETLERARDFNLLLAALDAAGLTATVADGGPFTLFAPTDRAFEDLARLLGVEPADLLERPDLPNILLYHVLGEEVPAQRLVLQSTEETLFNANPILAVLERSGRRLSVKVNGANVVRPNVKASNGVVHAIDAVLLPPSEDVTFETVLDVLRFDGRFSTLLLAVETAGLAGALAGDDLTLFAPTDDAFAALLAELGATPEQLLARSDLPDILKYHVAAGRLGALELLLEGRTDTLQGDSVFVRFRGGQVFVNDSKVINPNVNTPNAIFHSIDAVLLP